MSADAFAGFLQWTAEALKSQALTKPIWDFVFPLSVSEICPAPFQHISLGGYSLSIRWPLVAIFCVIGILGGIGLGAQLLFSPKRGSQQVSGYFMWGFTFIWYAFMCLGALFTHCIETDYNRVFYLMDVIATGCIGVSAVGGFLCVWNVIDDKRLIWKLSAFSIYSVFSVLAVTTTPMIRDQVYILPTLACIVAFARHRMTFGRKARLQELVSSEHFNAKAAEKWLDISVFASYLSIGSVLADRWLCHTLGSHGSFLFWVFGGCDMALLGAYKFITVLHSSSPGPYNVKAKAM